MSLFKTLFAAVAVAFGSASLAAPIATAQGSTVGVIDYGKVERESKAGINISQQLKTIDDGLKAELAPGAADLQATSTAIQPKIEGLSPAQIQQKGQTDEAFAQEYVTYIQKQQLMESNTQKAGLVLQATSTEAWKTFDRQAKSLIEQVATENGVDIVFERKQVMFLQPSVDLTAALIAKLDATMPSVPVVRQNNIELVVGRGGQILGAQAASGTE